MQVRKQQLELGWNDRLAPGREKSTPRPRAATRPLNSHAEHIMRSAGLDEAHAGVKTARVSVDSFRYTDDTTLWQKAKN